MPKVSKDTVAHVDDFQLGVDRHDELEGYTVNFVSVSQDVDLAPLLKGLPDDQCQCPHWGYVFKGRLTNRFGDREETLEAGDAFYMPPGHTQAAEAGSEFVVFSPTEELRVTEEAIQRNMAASMAGDRPA
jgi:hypothetical protein